VPQRVARTRRAMTKAKWQYVIVNGRWYKAIDGETVST
jgi:hypothetical protein